jgi:hypothetical protein
MFKVWCDELKNNEMLQVYETLVPLKNDGYEIRVFNLLKYFIEYKKKLFLNLLKIKDGIILLNMFIT